MKVRYNSKVSFNAAGGDRNREADPTLHCPLTHTMIPFFHFQISNIFQGLFLSNIKHRFPTICLTCWSNHQTLDAHILGTMLFSTLDRQCYTKVSKLGLNTLELHEDPMPPPGSLPCEMSPHMHCCQQPFEARPRLSDPNVIWIITSWPITNKTYIAQINT